MKKLLVLLFFLQTMFLQAIEQKMILSAHLGTKDAAKDLYKIEKFFQENQRAKALQAKHHLGLQMELLEDYVLVTIKPISLTSVKNDLHYLLQEKFPQNFVVDDTPMRDTLSVKKVIKELKSPKEVLVETKDKSEKISVEKAITKSEMQMFDHVKLFWEELESEWIALFLLALAGFMLIYRSTRQISKIKALQKKVEVYQGKLEDDIEDMGEKND